MGWPGALLGQLTARLVGDFLVRTEWQAVNETGGLGGSRSRRALFAASFSPALVWIGRRTSARRALVGDVWLRKVKRAPHPRRLGAALIAAR